MSLLDTFSGGVPAEALADRVGMSLLDTFSGRESGGISAAAVVEDVDVPVPPVAAAPIVAANVAAKPKRVRRTRQQIDAQKIIDARRKDSEAQLSLSEKRALVGSKGGKKKAARARACKMNRASAQKKVAADRLDPEVNDLNQESFLATAKFGGKRTSPAVPPIADSTSCTAIVPHNAISLGPLCFQAYVSVTMMQMCISPIVGKLTEASLAVEKHFSLWLAELTLYGLCRRDAVAKQSVVGSGRWRPSYSFSDHEWPRQRFFKCTSFCVLRMEFAT